MASFISTSGLIFCLSIISCHGFLNDGLFDETQIGQIGCNNLNPPTNGVKGPLVADSFSNAVDMNTNFKLEWKFNSTHIMFRTSCKTAGYIALGISQEGRMVNSDMAIGWVDTEGETHFSDRYAAEYAPPKIDEHQDWFLVSGSKTDDVTTIVSIRPLDPCDGPDFPIKAGDNFVIYAYGKLNGYGTDIAYHILNKGVKTINFFGN